MKIFEIIKPGHYSSIQDEGRYGYRYYAIPQSGSLDSLSHRLANYLVGNSVQDPLVEIVGGNFRCKILSRAIIGITGASHKTLLNGKDIDGRQSLQVVSGDVLEIESSCPAYLTVSGRIVAQSHFDSVSTYPMARLGGLDGNILAKGDVICYELSGTHIDNKLPEEIMPKTGSESIIRILKGPEFEELEIDASIFETRTWKVSSKSNRMGIRLEGGKFETDNREMVSVPTFPGTIQLTHEGQPIVLLNDAQTTGGYPRIGQVIMADLPRLSRMILGGLIKFKFVDILEARYILNQKEAFINHALS